MKHSHNSAFRFALFFCFMILGCTAALAQPISQVFEDWATTEGTQHFFVRSDMAIDPDNNVVVVGATLNGNGDYDLLVAEFSTGGELLWIDQYDGAGNGDDVATALAIDASGNVYVTGSTFTSSTDTLDVVTIGYDTDGTREWVDVYAGAGSLMDVGTCIAYSGGGVYVGGFVGDGFIDYLGLKYTTSGTLVWDTNYDYATLPDYCAKLVVDGGSVYLSGATYVGGADWDMLVVELDKDDGSFVDDATESGGTLGFLGVNAMETDLNGNIYLTGTVSSLTDTDIHTVKIDASMNVAWAEDFSSDGTQRDEGMALAVDDNGNVYVGGYKDSVGQATDFVTLMYDDAGSLQWSAMWNDTADGGDTVKAVAVDGNGNVTVTGTAWNGHSFDYHTIQYDNAGDMVWEVSYDDKRGYNDHPCDIAVDSDDNVVVTGQTFDPSDSTYSYTTVRYVVRAFVAPVDSDSVSTSLRWIANRDQLTDTTDTNLVERVRFYSNQCYPNMYFMDDSLSYVFFQGVDTTDEDTLHRIDMTFVDAEATAKLLPLGKQRYWNNYYLGHIPEGRPFVSLYERMYMQDVWPNIDVMYSSNQRGLKYYIIVHPSGETGAVKLEYHGYEDLYVDGSDALVIESSIGELVQPQALAYEMDGSGELSLLGWQPEYSVSSGEVTFGELGEWDGTLVIEVNWGYRIAGNVEPGWSTFYGGSGDDMAYDIVTTDDGRLYGGGETKSTDFPLQGASQPALLGDVDAFVGGFDVNYHRLWMTYFGGNKEDRGFGVAHDYDKWVYLCGETGYPSAGTQPILHTSISNLNGYVNTYAGPTGFIARFDDVDGTIDWSTSFGGGSEGTCIEIECDHSGNAYLVGHNAFGFTTSANTCTSTNNGVFPKCNSGSNTAVLQQTTHNSGHTRATDAFIAKFYNAELKWSTLFGGFGDDYLSDLAIDHYYNSVYVVGQTGSIRDYTIASPCTTGAVAYMPVCTLTTGYNQINLNGNNASINPSPTDGLIAQFDFDGVLQWSSFYGGSNNDNITSVAILPQDLNKTQVNPAPGQILFSGVTATSTYGANCVVPSNNGFPACSTSGQYQVTFRGGATDAFIALLDFDKDMLWSTYFGGIQSDDVAYGTGLHSWPFQGPKVAINDIGQKYLFGETQSGSNNTAAIPTDTEIDMYFEDEHGDKLLSANTDCFVTRFNASEQIDFSTYFGGEGAEYNGGISLYHDRVYICGGTKSVSGFPLHDADGTLTNAYFQDYASIPGSTSAAVSDGFFAQLRTSNNVVSIESPSGADAKSFSALVYPNPTQAEVTIEWEMEKPGKVHYSVVNLMGTTLVEEVLQGATGRNIERIDLRSQPAGVYILGLEVNGITYSRKIIVGK